MTGQDWVLLCHPGQLGLGWVIAAHLDEHITAVRQSPLVLPGHHLLVPADFAAAYAQPDPDGLTRIRLECGDTFTIPRPMNVGDMIPCPRCGIRVIITWAEPAPPPLPAYWPDGQPLNTTWLETL